MNYNRAAMKKEVKQAMRQTRPHPMLVTLLYHIVSGAGNVLIALLFAFALFILLVLSLTPMQRVYSAFVHHYSMDYALENLPPLLLTGLAALVVCFLFFILFTIWSGLMNVGYSGYCMDMSRNANPQLTRIFSGFRRLGPTVKAYLQVAVFLFLWNLLYAAAALGALFVVSLTVFLLSLIPVVGWVLGPILGVLLYPAIPILWFIAVIRVFYRYAMVPFAIADNEESITASEAVLASQALMRGRMGRYFMLNFSFIGWYLVMVVIWHVGNGVNYVILMLSSLLSRSDNSSIPFGRIDNLGELIGYIIRSRGPIAIVIAVVYLLCVGGIFILNFWLTPFMTGCRARFYEYAVAGDPVIQPAPAGVQPVQPGYYGVQPVQPGYYGGQPGQPDYYGGQPVQPGYYGGQPGQPDYYGGQPGQPGYYGVQPGQPDYYGGQPGQPGYYGGQPQGGQPPEYPAAPDGTPQPPGGPNYPPY